ncbi:MAG: hypothetical protein IJ094_07485, partial [Bacilli bacterium]|nr:hypothetical protein [Bacilli bacterium]
KKVISNILILILAVVLFCAAFVLTWTHLKKESLLNSKLKNINEDLENIEKVSSYNNPIIPNGFHKLETDSATWVLDEEENPKGWNNGLVIEDDIGNQFVWVPYDKSYQNGYDKLKDYLEDEFQVKKQIKKYGGFYIARFEAGVPIDRQNTLQNISVDTSDNEGVTASKKGVIPWYYISSENANKNAKLMYKDNLYVDGNLLNIKQRAIVDEWLKNSGYDFNNLKEYGNYSNSKFKFNCLYSNDLGKNYKLENGIQEKNENIILTTGAIEQFKVNNIYDYFGNVGESTKSIGQDSKYICYSCGGYYDNSDKTDNYTHAWANSKTGFRVYLIIK